MLSSSSTRSFEPIFLWRRSVGRQVWVYAEGVRLRRTTCALENNVFHADKLAANTTTITAVVVMVAITYTRCAAPRLSDGVMETRLNGPKPNGCFGVTIVVISTPSQWWTGSVPAYHCQLVSRSSLPGRGWLTNHNQFKCCTNINIKL